MMTSRSNSAKTPSICTSMRPTGVEVSEPEVSEILRSIHEDFAYLRRELVNYHYLERGEGRYRVGRAGAHPSADRTPGDPGLGGRLVA